MSAQLESITSQRRGFEAFFAERVVSEAATPRTLAGILHAHFPLTSFSGERVLHVTECRLDSEHDPSRAHVQVHLRLDDDGAVQADWVPFGTVLQPTETGAFTVNGHLSAASVDDPVHLRDRLVEFYGGALIRLVRILRERLALFTDLVPSQLMPEKTVAVPDEVILGAGTRPLVLTAEHGPGPLMFSTRPGPTVTLSPSASARLRSNHVAEVWLGPWVRGIEGTRCPPGLPAEAFRHLAEDGTPVVGTTLRAGEPLLAQSMPSELPLASTWPDAHGGLRTRVIAVPPGDDGTVTAVSLHPPKAVLAAEHALAVGDVLLDARTGDRHVVHGIDATLSDADATWPGESSEVSVLKIRSARACLRGCGYGMRDQNGVPPTDLSEFGAIRPPHWALETVVRELPALGAEWIQRRVERVRALFFGAQLELVDEPAGMRLRRPEPSSEYVAKHGSRWTVPCRTHGFRTVLR